MGLMEINCNDNLFLKRIKIENDSDMLMLLKIQNDLEKNGITAENVYKLTRKFIWSSKK